jgi:hypothetical protein
MGKVAPRAWTQKYIPSKLGQFALDIAEQAGQEYLQSHTGQLGSHLGEYKTTWRKDPRPLIEQLEDAHKGGLYEGGLAALAGGVLLIFRIPAFLQGLRQYAASKVMHEKLKMASSIYQQTKVKDTVPGAGEQALDAVLTGSDAEVVSLDAKSLNEYFMVRPDYIRKQTLEALGIDADSFLAAVESGQAVEFKLSSWLSNIAETELGVAMVADLRVGDMQTIRESVKAREDMIRKIDSLEQTIQEFAKNEEPTPREVKEFREKLRGFGFNPDSADAVIDVLQKGLATFARRRGETLATLAERIGLKLHIDSENAMFVPGEQEAGINSYYMISKAAYQAAQMLGITSREVDAIWGLLQEVSAFDKEVGKALKEQRATYEELNAYLQIADPKVRTRFASGVEAINKLFGLRLKPFDPDGSVSKETFEGLKKVEGRKDELTTEQKKTFRENIGGFMAGLARPSVFTIGKLFEQRPDLAEKILQVQDRIDRTFGRTPIVEVVELPDGRRRVQLVATPIERQLKAGESEADPGARPLYGGFRRTFTQSLLDFLPAEVFEHFRGTLVKAIETAYEQGMVEGTLPLKLVKQLTDLSIESLGNTGIAAVVPLKLAEKTDYALNLNSMCPIMMLGAHGCYLDGCYVSGMGRSGTYINFYARAAYTAEILQLSDEQVNLLNSIGGLRLNGAGDLTWEFEAQFRDVVRHAQMRGLELKVITKQDDTIEMLAAMQASGQSIDHVQVQPSLDPYWIPITEDNLVSSLANQSDVVQEFLKNPDDAALADQVIEWYRQHNREARLIDGVLYRRYGLSPEKFEALQAKHPGVKMQPRIVVGTPQEIAYYAKHHPQYLQTWMHAAVRSGMYSEVHGRVLEKGEIGNFQDRIAITQDENGRWQIQAQEWVGGKPKTSISVEAAKKIYAIRKKIDDLEKAKKPKDRDARLAALQAELEEVLGSLKAQADVLRDKVKKVTRALYDSVRDEIEKDPDSDTIFRRLAGMLKDEPGSLCCAAGADIYACNNCRASCHMGLQTFGRVTLASQIRSLLQRIQDIKQGVENSRPGEYYMRLKHGTASDFNVFLLQYMGKGTGGQLEGWGLYFTEEESVARHYAESIRAKGIKASFSPLSHQEFFDRLDESYRLANDEATRNLPLEPGKTPDSQRYQLFSLLSVIDYNAMLPPGDLADSVKEALEALHGPGSGSTPTDPVVYRVLFNAFSHLYGLDRGALTGLKSTFPADVYATFSSLLDRVDAWGDSSSFTGVDAASFWSEAVLELSKLAGHFSAEGRDFISGVHRLKGLLQLASNQVDLAANPAYTLLRDTLAVVSVPDVKAVLYDVDVAIEGLPILSWDSKVPKNILELVKSQAILEEEFGLLSSLDLHGVPPSADLKGHELYTSLSDYFDGDREASLFLLRAGIPGLKYRGDRKTARYYNYVIWDANLISIQGKEYFAQQGDEVLGSFPADFDADAVISLFKGAKHKPAVVLHEIGHLFLRLHQQLIQDGVADERAVRDYAYLTQTFGDLSVRENVEKLIDAWMQYLRGGQAPVPHLASAFRRFAAWIVNLYRAIKLRLGPNINPELRDVFDHWLATDEEIATAQAYYQTLASAVEILDQVSPPAGTLRGKKPRVAKPEDGQVEATEEIVSLDEESIQAENDPASTPQELQEQRARQAWSEAREKLDRRTAEARDREARRRVALWLGETGGWAQLVAKAREKLEALPAYQALSALRQAGGLAPEVLLVLDEAEASPEALADELRSKHGKWIVATPTGKKGVRSVEEADAVARAAGFASAREMVRTIRGVDPIGDAAKVEAESQKAALYERFRRDLEHWEGRGASGEGATHNDVTLAFLLTEIEVLAARLDSTRHKAISQAELRAMRDAINAYFDDLPANASKRYKIWAAREAQAAQEALTAAGKGDMAAAYEARKMQLTYHLLLLRSVEKREWLAAFNRRWSALRLKVDKLPEGIRQTVQDLVATYLKRGESPKDAQAHALFLPEESLNGIDDAGLKSILQDLADGIPGWMISKEHAPEQSIEEMSFTQLSQLDDVFRMLVDEGRGILAAFKQGDIETAQQLADLAAQTMRTLPSRRIPDRSTKKGRVKRTGAQAAAHVKQIEFLCEELDGSPMAQGKPIGLLHRMFAGIQTAAAQVELRFAQVFSGPRGLKEAFGILQKERTRLQKELGGKHFDIDGVPFPRAITDSQRGQRRWTFDSVLGVLLNIGNDANLYGLQESVYQLTNEQIDILKGLFSTQGAQAVQMIWDSVNSLYPELVQAQWLLRKQRLQKEPAQALTWRTADGDVLELPGGYYPKIFDPLISERTQARTEKEDIAARILQDSIRSSNRPRDGFVKNRLRDKDDKPISKEPVLLSSSILIPHIREVLHLCYLGPWLKDWDNLTKNKTFRDEVIRVRGEEMYGALRRWLNQIARPERRRSDPWSRFLDKLTSLFTVSTLGLNIFTGVKQRLSTFNAIEAMNRYGDGLKYYMLGARELGLGGMAGGGRTADVIETIFRLSQFMRVRQDAVDREIVSHTMDMSKFPLEVSIGDKRFTASQFKAFVFHWIRMNDRATVFSVWLGAFRQALDKKLNGITEGSSMQEAEAQAAAYADRIVSMSQPSGLTVDLSELQRKQGVARLLTLFMTWRIRFLNRLMWYNTARKTGQIQFKDQLRQFMTEVALPAWAWMGVSALLLRPDDEPEWQDWLIQPGSDVIHAVPLAGELYDTVVKGWPVRLPAAAGAERARDARAALTDGEITAGTILTLRTLEWFAGLPFSNIPRDVIKLAYRHSGEKYPKEWR